MQNLRSDVNTIKLISLAAGLGTFQSFVVYRAVVSSVERANDQLASAPPPPPPPPLYID